MCTISSIRFLPGPILHMLLHIRQHKAHEVALSECFIRVKSIHAYQPLSPQKTVFITFNVPIMFLTIGGTCSGDEACMEVPWYPWLVPVAKPLNSGSSCKQRDSTRLLESRTHSIFWPSVKSCGIHRPVCFRKPKPSQRTRVTVALLVISRPAQGFRMQTGTLLGDCVETPPGRNSAGFSQNGADQTKRVF
jgi:hypothetical protein